MKKFFMKLTAIAVMPMLLAACTKDEVNPTPTNGGKEGEIELILKNESVADGTRAFGSGTTESWEKSISSAVLIVYNTSGHANPAPRTDRRRNERLDHDADQVRTSGRERRCLVRFLCRY